MVQEKLQEYKASFESYCPEITKIVRVLLSYIFANCCTTFVNHSVSVSLVGKPKAFQGRKLELISENGTNAEKEQGQHVDLDWHQTKK